ncbi:MAG: PQQ-binding-like beta-propeller repeat protein, partial [Phycisphaerae bacterium]
MNKLPISRDIRSRTQIENEAGAILTQHRRPLRRAACANAARFLACLLLLPALPVGAQPTSPSGHEVRPSARKFPADEWPMFRGTPAQEGVSAATVGDKLRLRWQVELGDAITAGIVIADQVVFAATENGHLFALELTTGQKRWEFTVENDFFFAPPTVIGDRVYLGSDSGSMFAIARDTGNQIWEFKTTGAIYSSLNYVGEPGKDSLKLLFGSYDGSLYCLNSDGKLLW